MIRYLIGIVPGIFIVAFGLWQNHKKSGFPDSIGEIIPENKQQKPNKAYLICIPFLFILFAFLLFFKVDEIPLVYHVDEAGTAYDALSIVNYGVDRFLYKNPVYFVTFGDGQSALYVYLAAFFIKVFGYSILAVRLPSIIFALVSALFLVYLMRFEYGKTAALICLALFCILPFSIMHSRWGLDAFLLFPMSIISFVCLYFAVRSGKNRDYFLAGLMLGLTLYTYAVSYVFLILFLILFLLCLVLTGKIRWSNLFSLGIPLFLLALPLMLMIAVNNGIIDEIRTPFISIPKLPSYRGGDLNFRHIIKNLEFNEFNLFFRTLFYDGISYNSNLKFGTLYYFSLPFLLLGGFISIKNALKSLSKKKLSLDVMMLCVFLSALITSLLIIEVNVNRCCEIYFPFIYYLCLGLFVVVHNKKIISLLTGVIYFFFFALFIRFYFTQFPDSYKTSGSLPDLEKAIEFVDSINPDKKTVNLIAGREPHIYYLLAEKIDPYEFNRNKIMGKNNFGFYDILGLNNYRFLKYINWDNIPEEPIYIFRVYDNFPWQLDLMEMEMKQFGAVKVYYSPKYYSETGSE